MTISGVFSKDANAVLDYKFDWKGLTNGSPGATSDWLDSTETIGTDTGDVSITITPSETGGLTVNSYSLTDTFTSVTVWLSGGTSGTIYYVTCKIVTSDGRTDERTIEIDVTGITNGYATLQELKSSDVLSLKDTSHDSTIEREISAASRKIDEFCGRYFYAVSGSESRYFTPNRNDSLYIDDLYSSSGLVVALDTNRDGTYDLTWSASDYDLWPYNPVNGRPYIRIETTLVNGYAFYQYPKSVKITSSYWGWASVPDAVNQACVMLANRLHKRNQTILGQSGATAFGSLTLKIPKMDDDIIELLLPYRKTYT